MLMVVDQILQALYEVLAHKYTEVTEPPELTVGSSVKTLPELARLL